MQQEPVHHFLIKGADNMPHLLCLGDSITDCGRIFDFPPLGCGYVQQIEHRLRNCGKNWMISNCGTDGFTTARLLSNTPLFYLPKNADITTILIGINDVGVIMNTCESSDGRMHLLEQSLKNYHQILTLFFNKKQRLVLMEPFLFSRPQEYLNWLPWREKMSLGMQSLADSYGFPYLLLQKYFEEKAEQYGTDALTTDGIHLTAFGHELLSDRLFPLLRTMY